MSIDGEMNKDEWYIYTMEYYSTIKKKKMLLAVTQMDREIVILSEVNQKDKYHLICRT